jgi:hypothetical protein
MFLYDTLYPFQGFLVHLSGPAVQGVRDGALTHLRQGRDFLHGYHMFTSIV